MKIHVEMDMTPEEARTLMGLPDVTALHEQMLAEMERRMKAAMDTSDPEAMMKAWMPMGGAGFRAIPDDSCGTAPGWRRAAEETAPKRLMTARHDLCALHSARPGRRGGHAGVGAGCWRARLKP